MQDAAERRHANAEPKLEVKSEVARTLIAAMEKGDTPWQKPWNARSLLPTNLATNNGYRGMNRILLALAGAGRVSNQWATYQQAAAKGWQVRKGERGTTIAKVVELARDGAGENEPAAPSGDAAHSEARRSKGFALRRYVVFNAEQIEGATQQGPQEDRGFEPVERAEAIMQALKERTNLTIAHGGDRACYVPSTDTVLLPNRGDFRALPGTAKKDIAASQAFAYFSVAMHECCHSSMSPRRLDRAEAYAKRWGDEAYALEELTAQIGSAILAAETGVPMSKDPDHVQAHAGYLRSWIQAIEADPMAIFTAAKNADRISEYLLGLEREWTAARSNAEWVAQYDAELTR